MNFPYVLTLQRKGGKVHRLKVCLRQMRLRALQLFC